MFITENDLNELAKMLLVTLEELRSESRKGRIVEARKLLAKYLVDETGKTEEDAGAMINRHRTSVHYYVKNINERLEIYRYLNAFYQNFRMEANALLFEHTTTPYMYFLKASEKVLSQLF